MAGSLLAMARKAAKAAATSVGFEDDIILETRNGLSIANVKGLAAKHWLDFDALGASVSSKKAHVTVKEEDLVELDYPVRNLKGEVNLYGHKVTVKDSTGIDKTYVVVEQFPNETFGLIPLLLGDYDDN